MKLFPAILLRIFAFFITHCAIFVHADYSVDQIKHPRDNPRIQVDIVFPTALKELSTAFKQIVHESLFQVENAYQIHFKDDFSVYYDASPDFHNGLSTVIPTNRVYVHLEAPHIYSSIGLSEDYLLETTVHELSHMITLQQRGGLFSFFDFFVGNTSRPNGAWPLWIHEGLAVWAESKLGGRGHSGVIDSDLRKYAEYFQRKKVHPLNNKSLDGPHSVYRTHSAARSRIEKGSLPYHFGYLMFKEIESLFPQKNPGQFVTLSQSSLGSAYRISFRKWGVDLDKTFSTARQKWSTPVPREMLEAPPSEKVLSKAPTIVGPFQSHSTSSWVSLETNGKTYLNWIAKRKKKRVQWTDSYNSPLSAFFNQKEKQWVVLRRTTALNSNQKAQRRVSVYNIHAEKLCSFPLPDKIREIHYNHNTLSWIRTDRNNHAVFEKAQLQKLSRCQLKPPVRLARSSQAFERFSSPYTNGRFFAYSQSSGRNLNKERIVTNYFSINTKTTLSSPQQIPLSFCSKDTLACLLAFEFSKNYRGPVLIYANKKHSIYKRLNTIKTSSKGTVYNNQLGKFIRVDEFWEKDQITSFTPDSFSRELISANLNLESPEKYPPIKQKPRITSLEKKQRSYSLWPSIWPQYWLPNFSIYDKGYFASGFTEYQDLSKRWSGATALGFDSYTSRPFISTALNRKKLSIGFDQLNLSASYSPRVTSGTVQERYSAAVSLKATTPLFYNWALSLSPGVYYLNGSKSSQVSHFSYVAPGLSWALFSPRIQNHKSPSYQISKNRWSFQSHGNFRWLKGQDLYSNAILQGRLGRTGLQVLAEYADSAPLNYPAVFHEWGGRATFSTQNQTFLARGYSARIGPSTKIGRATAEWGFKLFEPKWALSWNRAHLKDIELRFFYEALSTDLRADFNGDGKLDPTNINFGEDLFKSAGVEIDLFTQILQYANMKYTLGFSKGFDLGGETRFSLALSSSLNL